MSVEGLVGPCCNTKSIESHDKVLSSTLAAHVPKD